MQQVYGGTPTKPAEHIFNQVDNTVVMWCAETGK